MAYPKFKAIGDVFLPETVFKLHPRSIAISRCVFKCNMFILVCCVDVGLDSILHVAFPSSDEKGSLMKVVENYVL
ncbi:unnamed protein product [Prunus armeniaca]